MLCQKCHPPLCSRALCVLPWHWQGGTAKLVMGKMQLEGQQVALKKPLAIMTLVTPEDSTKKEYHAAGVVRHKLVFRTRPVPASRPPLPEPSTTVGSKRARPSDATQP